MDLSTRQLRALVEVVEQGTFTDAAIALGTSQASVSRMIASLETSVGARLLRRTSRSVSLTSAGETTLAHARHVLAEVDRLARALDASGGSLRLGYSWAVLGAHTSAVLDAWAGRHPCVRLDLVQSISPTAGLLEGVADIAVVRSGRTDRRFAEAVVGREDRFAGVPASDPLARRRVLSVADFEGRRVAFDPMTGSTPKELWESAGVTVRFEEVHGVDAWLNLIATGHALGVTAESTTRHHQRPDVRYRRIRDAEPVEVRLLWWADDPPAHVDDFVSLIREEFAT